ncbi:glycosyltransferase family 2 protein [Desulfofundulus salinus]|uniref:Glycosyltransferase family 2 protein n=1 Tax=Desulfofundulus salinus TaxID=2419843 RepID=A0A494WQX5_9FIRM|nr:glycosyltransferase family 2 protein [Desulfofundulus salinum]RKO65548.1 glycosyltransferase family 2 protein [Desulfofundulus salinum]
MPFLMKEKLTSIIIPTRNQLSLTVLCLENIIKYTPEPVEIIVVDNGSTDGIREYLRSVSEIRLLENGRNLGFAAACNRGLAVARGDYLLLLNNDTLVTPGWLSGLISHLKKYPGAGLVGPLSNCGGVTQTMPVAPPSLDRLEEFSRRLALQNRGQCRPVPVLSGFCLLFTRRVLNTIGGLDPRFNPGNFEDDDFCLRARLAGFVLLVAADVFVYHFGQRTFTGEGMDYRAALQTGWEKFRLKWKLPPNFPPEKRHTSPLILNQAFDPCRHMIPLE